MQAHLCQPFLVPYENITDAQHHARHRHCHKRQHINQFFQLKTGIRKHIRHAKPNQDAKHGGNSRQPQRMFDAAYHAARRG